MPEHKRYDAAVVIKSHLKLLLFFSSSFEPKSHRGSAADADRRARLHIASFSLCGGLSSKNSATSRARVFGL